MMAVKAFAEKQRPAMAPHSLRALLHRRILGVKQI